MAADTAPKIHVGDLPVFKITVRDALGALYPIDSASVMQMKFTKPDPTAAVVVKTAVWDTDGTDAVLKYVAIAGDMDMEGDWERRAYLVTPGWSGHTTVEQFEVFAV